jgi:DNA polymerase-3 subunit alpha
MQSHLSDVALIIPADSAIDSILSQLPQNDVYAGLAQPMTQGFLRPKIPFLTVRYLNAGDAETLAILHHIKNGTKYDDSLTSNHFENLRAESDVRALFDAESLKNLNRLVSEISYDIAFDTLPLRFNPEN